VLKVSDPSSERRKGSPTTRAVFLGLRQRYEGRAGSGASLPFSFVIRCAGGCTLLYSHPLYWLLPLRVLGWVERLVGEFLSLDFPIS